MQQLQQGNDRSPLPSIFTQQTGDPELLAAKTGVDWLAEANLADVYLWLAEAEADPSDGLVQQLCSLVPPDVLV